MGKSSLVNKSAISLNLLHLLLILVITISTAPLQLLLCHQDNHIFNNFESVHLVHIWAILCYVYLLVCTCLIFKPHSFLLPLFRLGKPLPHAIHMLQYPRQSNYQNFPHSLDTSATSYIVSFP